EGDEQAQQGSHQGPDDGRKGELADDIVVVTELFQFRVHEGGPCGCPPLCKLVASRDLRGFRSHRATGDAEFSFACKRGERARKWACAARFWSARALPCAPLAGQHAGFAFASAAG